jgi:LysM domain-containing protein
MSGAGPSRAADLPVAPDTAAICPYLLAADGAWRASTPRRDHRCTAVVPAAILATEKQRRLCLLAAHLECSTYLAAVAARNASAGAIRGRGPRRAMPRTAPVLLDQGRLSISIPGMPDRGIGQGGLVALMAVAFGALAVTRLTGGGPNIVPTVAGEGGTPSPSIVASSRPAATSEPTVPEATAGDVPSHTLVPSDVEPTPRSPTPRSSTPTAADSTPRPASGGTYRVQSGDTLSEIAAANGTTWQVLAQLNGITDPRKIRVGQVLKLP